MSPSTSHKPTRWMRRELPGAAALLAGGVGFVGLVLVHVAMGSSPAALGMAVGAEAPLWNLELHDLGGEQAVASPVLPPSTSDRTAVQGVCTASEADSTEPLVEPSHPRSESEWFEAYSSASVAELDSEAQTVLVAGQVQEQAVGLLLAFESRGQAAAREPFLRAAELPETGQRGLSIPAFVVMRLTKSASDAEARRTLEQLAFSQGSPLSIRLRGQAIAALVANTPQTECARLADRLGCLSDPRLLASARGAAASAGVPAP